MLIAVVVVSVLATTGVIVWACWKLEENWKRHERERSHLHNRFWSIINANFWDEDNDQSDRK